MSHTPLATPLPWPQSSTDWVPQRPRPDQRTPGSTRLARHIPPGWLFPSVKRLPKTFPKMFPKKNVCPPPFTSTVLWALWPAVGGLHAPPLPPWSAVARITPTLPATCTVLPCMSTKRDFRQTLRRLVGVWRSAGWRWGISLVAPRRPGRRSPPPPKLWQKRVSEVGRRVWTRRRSVAEGHWRWGAGGGECRGVRGCRAEPTAGA